MHFGSVFEYQYRNLKISACNGCPNLSRTQKQTDTNTDKGLSFSNTNSDFLRILRNKIASNNAKIDNIFQFKFICLINVQFPIICYG